MRRRGRHRARADAARFRPGGGRRRGPRRASAIPPPSVLVLAADHIVRKPDRFIEACRSALPAARDGKIVTFGIKPTDPATSYGYIRPASKLDGGAAVLVEAFVEKPDAATAARYVADNYLWNSGNFMFRADVMLDEIERFEPAMAEAARGGGRRRGTQDLDFLRLAAGAVRARAEEIDRLCGDGAHQARRRRAGRYRLVGYRKLGRGVGRSRAGRRRQRHQRARSSRSTAATSWCARTTSILTAVVGVDDVVVVATDDAVLVAARDKAEKVKALVETLKAPNRGEAVEHRRIYRPWGYYQGVDAGTRYQVKRIVVNAGARLSLQKHFHRAEHWVVVEGHRRGHDRRGKSASCTRTSSVYIPIGSVHRLANPGKIPLELIEVQVGSYLGEDDIVRLDDIYGRR